jgi:hypothetical protein
MALLQTAWLCGGRDLAVALAASAVTIGRSVFHHAFSNPRADWVWCGAAAAGPPCGLVAAAALLMVHVATCAMGTEL